MLKLMIVVSLSVGCTTSVISGRNQGTIDSGSTSGRLDRHWLFDDDWGQKTSSGSAASSGQSAGSSSGAAGGSSGGTTGTTGGYTGDAGPCRGNGAHCASDAQCCMGACNDGCGQVFGGNCFDDGNCTSRNCVNDQCACSVADSSGLAPCAIDQDCCGEIGCQRFADGDALTGACCEPVGGSCQQATDCCGENCVDGECECLPTGSACAGATTDPLTAFSCCSGMCVRETCEAGPGGAV